MKISEKELEDYIFKNHNKKILGSFLSGNLITRQINFKAYGRFDILIIDAESSNFIKYKIVELKEDEIDYKALGQICRYGVALKRTLKKIYPELEEDIDYSIDLYLIGKNIDMKEDFIFISERINNLSIYTYDINLEEGISFEYVNERGWHRKKEKTNYTIKKFVRKAMINCENRYRECIKEYNKKQNEK